MALLTPLNVARRIAALIGIVVLIGLALTLLWRVYVHHREADPDEREEAVTVSIGRPRFDIRKNYDPFALNYSPTATSGSGTPGAISEVRRKQIT